MKRKLLSTVTIVFLLIVMVCTPILVNISLGSAYAEISAQAMAINEGNKGRSISYKENLDELHKKIDSLIPEKKNWLQKGISNVKSGKTLDKAASIGIQAAMEMLTNRDNVNYKNLCIDTCMGLINLAATCFGLGGVSDALLGPLAELGKDKSPSEIQLLKEHIDEQFEIVNQGIEDIRSDISELSENMDKSLEEAVTALKDAIEAQAAGDKVYAFTFSGEGNFDYTLFKNYINGLSDSSNELARYAYYDRLTKSITNGAPDAVIEENYNALYNSLTTVGNERMPYVNILRQYILEDVFGSSIQRYYYDWLSSNRELLEKTGKNVEWEAISFTQDLYRTMLTAESCLMTCYNYFLFKIYQEYGVNPSDNDSYRHVNQDGSVTLINYGDIIREMENLNNEERANQLEEQIIKDVAYILAMEESYLLESADGDFYYIVNNDRNTFAQVRLGQTVHMNMLSDEICEMFGVNPQKFKYFKGSSEECSGQITVPSNRSSFNVSLKYGDTEIYSLNFKIDNLKFSGGSGTASDPYLISDKSQFDLITMGKKGKGVHYKLIGDINFNNAVKSSPYGNETDTFQGVLDGNGYSIKNLKITSNNHIGLFHTISIDGEVRNLTLEGITFGGSINDTTDTIYAGSICAKNLGKINNCHLVNSKIEASRDTKTKDKNIEMFVGGIAGINSGDSAIINNCSIKSSKINASSNRAYGDGRNDKNENQILIGGITAKLCSNGSKLSNCMVLEGCEIKGSAKSEEDWILFCDNDPTVEVFIYKICKNDGTIENVYCSSDIVCQATTETNTGRADCKGEVYNPSATNGKNNVITNFPNVNKDYTVRFEYDGAINTQYNIKESQLYKYEEDFLKKEKLKIFVDGNQITDYQILGYYGLDTHKSDKIDGEAKSVTIIIMARLDKEVILSFDMPIKVEKIQPKELKIVQKPQINYNQNDSISLSGGKFVLVWEDGTEEEVSPSIVSGGTNNLGENKIEVAYKGVSAFYNIKVNCEHEYEETIFAPTCINEGYTEFKCKYCQDRYVLEESIVEKLPHSIVIVGDKEPTCHVDGIGYTGDKYCDECEQLIEVGSDIPVLPHEYEALDGNSCKCIECKEDRTTKAHEYKSVENEKQIIYECATCGYTYTIDKRVSEDIARVVVGNSYGLVGRNDEIVVYIKMFNNPGITGVSFRIEYDERLQYVRHERGSLLSSASQFEVAQVNGVIGFVAASPNTYVDDGNLLMLVFKLPSNAQVMDKYDIEIAYTRKQFTGGQANAIDIVTMQGSITAVSHLPGDVNNDCAVDVLDTALVARYMAIQNTNDYDKMQEFLQSQQYNFDEFYADVNLDGYVDLSDLVIILQYFVGKNTQELASNEIEVLLNANNGSLEMDSIIIKCYDENGDRGVYPELPTPVRPGYRFDGWFTSFDINNPNTLKIETGSQFYYMPTYLKQVLYAHWTEIYTIEYNVNAPNTLSPILGDMEDSVYTYNESKPIAINNYSILGWEFKGWATSPSGEVVYFDGQEVSGLAHAGDVITLYAVWEANTYTIKFEKNKPDEASASIDKEINDIECVYDVKYAIPEMSYSLTGWTFKGWSTSVDGEIVYTSGQEIVNLTAEDDAVITLYAVWEANTYTIKFVSTKPSNATSDMTGSMEDIVVKYDEDVLLTNEFVLTGWNFIGWSKEEGGIVDFDDLQQVRNLCVNEGDEIVLYARWVMGYYTISYAQNELSCGCIVSGNMVDTKCAIDENAVLRQNQFSVIGHHFIGWAIKPLGDVVYQDSEAIFNLTIEDGAVVTLYAKWEVNEYTIKLHVNGTTYEENTHNVDNSYALLKGVAVSYKTGHTFSGWSTIENSNDKNDVIYLPNEEVGYIDGVLDNEIVELYAVYTPNTYTINYDLYKNNTKASSSSFSVTYGDESSFIDKLVWDKNYYLYQIKNKDNSAIVYTNNNAYESAVTPATVVGILSQIVNESVDVNKEVNIELITTRTEVTLNFNIGSISKHYDNAPTHNNITGYIRYGENSITIGNNKVVTESMSYHDIEYFTKDSAKYATLSSDGKKLNIVTLSYSNKGYTSFTVYVKWKNATAYTGYTYIYDYAGLKELRGQSLSGQKYLITKNITTTTTDWEPIASLTNGTIIDGGGNKISGLKCKQTFDMNQTYRGIGFINELQNGTVKNLIIDNATFELDVENTTKVKAMRGALGGGIAADVWGSGKISNCQVNNSTIDVYLRSDHGPSGQWKFVQVGGIAGVNTGTIDGCIVTSCIIKAEGAVKWDGQHAEVVAGGIVGFLKKGNVKNCKVDGVSGNKTEISTKACSWGEGTNSADTVYSYAGYIIGLRDVDYSTISGNTKTSYVLSTATKDVAYPFPNGNSKTKDGVDVASTDVHSLIKAS